MNDDKEFTLREVAEMLGVCEMTIRRAIKRNELGYFRRGSGRGRLVVLARHLDAYRKARTVEAVAA